MRVRQLAESIWRCPGQLTESATADEGSGIPRTATIINPRCYGGDFVFGVKLKTYGTGWTNSV